MVDGAPEGEPVEGRQCSEDALAVSRAGGSRDGSGGVALKGYVDSLGGSRSSGALRSRR